METWWVLRINIDRNLSSAVYLQIANGIIDSIKRGLIKVGETIPSTRRLSIALGVNRNTVIQALDVLLSEGWLASEERKRIYVSDKLSITKISEKKGIDRESVVPSRSNFTFFDDGLPDISCTPMVEIARAYRRIFSRKAQWNIMNLASEFGNDRFRDTVSSMLNQNRGMHTSFSEICITRGSQMALFLTAHCLLQKDDVVLIENPGFRPAWEAFRHAGATLIPISVDDEGVDIDSIEQVLKKRVVKAIYLTPHHQYPTTVTLSLHRRLRLIELSNQYDFTIIEDDYDNEFHFGQRPVMPLAAHQGINNYVYVGTLSKLIAPAIRIGYIVASANFIASVGRLRKIIDVQGDTIMEQSILDLMLSGEIRKHQKRMLTHYKDKRDFFDSLLRYYLQDKITYKVPDGGLAFWLKPNYGVDLLALKQKVNSRLIDFYPPNRFSFDHPIEGIRLGYASLSKENLEKGVKIMNDYL